jgi:myosin heavy subunit
VALTLFFFSRSLFFLPNVFICLAAIARYQLFAGAGPEMLKELLLEDSIASYPYVSAGKQELADVDDAAEWKNTMAAMDTLGFTTEERTDVLRILAAILNFGKVQFCGRGEWAEMNDTTYVCIDE